MKLKAHIMNTSNDDSNGNREDSSNSYHSDNHFIVKFLFPDDILEAFTNSNCYLLTKWLKMHTGCRLAILRDTAGKGVRGPVNIHALCQMQLNFKDNIPLVGLMDSIPEYSIDDPDEKVYYVDVIGIYKSKQHVIDYWEEEWEHQNWKFNAFELVTGDAAYYLHKYDSMSTMQELKMVDKVTNQIVDKLHELCK